jgi:hypothetical protein
MSAINIKKFLILYAITTTISVTPSPPPFQGTINEASMGPTNSSRVLFPFPLFSMTHPRTLRVASSSAQTEAEKRQKNETQNNDTRRSFRIKEIYIRSLYLKPARNANILHKNHGT